MRKGRTSGSGRAFSLVELLTAISVLMLLLGILFLALGQTGAVWRRARNQTGTYQSARFAADLITRTLSQSTLNVYDAYDDPANPTAYVRKSDLHFVVNPPPFTDFGQGNAIFFHAPMGQTLDSARYGGLPGLLNALGYYVTYGKNPGLPLFLQLLDRNRFRLMQFLAPTENVLVYASTGKQWFDDTLLNQYSSVVAENVILLLFWPRLSSQEDAKGNALTANYLYDSRMPAAPAPQTVTTCQQPPLVEVTLVAIDEASANRLPAGDGAAPPTQITQALAGLFRTSTEADYLRDLAALEIRLTDSHIGYRLFTRTVALRESKWSK